jgi:alkanesulfonate monooxygenase
VRQRAAERGRTLSFAIRLHVVVRGTGEEARREADALIEYVNDEAIAISQRTFARFGSVGAAADGSSA